MAANDNILDDEFPNDDFFPDVDDLFDDMTNDTSASFAAISYVILSSPPGLAFGLLVPVIDMDIFLVAYYLNCMTSFNKQLHVSIVIYIMLIMFDLLFFLIKFNRKCLIIQQECNTLLCNSYQQAYEGQSTSSNV